MTADDPALPAFARHRLFPWIAAAPFVLWPLYILSRGEVRWEMIAVMVLVPLMAFTRRRLFAGLLPVGLVAFLYDAMRFVKNVGLSPERVHDCDLRAAEVALFGVSVDGGPMGTLHDVFQAHPNVALDALCAVPYGTYIYTILAAAIFLYRRDFRRLQRFTWTFFLLNVAGFITYHVYPAAPPWYFHAHGCAVDLAARASAGPNLARVDALLGVDYFRGFYGRSNDIFGAVPSLHVAYPTLLALETWPYLNRPMRVVAVAYAALMCFAAVYLDHHWVIDVVVGLAYAAALLALVRRAFRPPAPVPVP
ncbi:MAG: superfamily protein [Myxococcaceae bacterium]|nr:superfamily protein [Myxococcaceae bacterium]